MRTFFRTLKFLLCSALVACGAARAEVLPPDWFEIRFMPENYEVTLASDAKFEGYYGASVRRMASGVKPGDFGGFIQAVRAGPWRGQRVAMRAWINEGFMKLKHGDTYTSPRIVFDAPSNLDFEQEPVR